MDFRKVAEEAGLKPKKVAEMVGVHPITVYRWYNGKEIPRGKELLNFLNVCGATIISKSGNRI